MITQLIWVWVSSLLDFHERGVITVFTGDAIDESTYQDLKRLVKRPT